MGIFSRLSKKRKQPESSDTFNVILKTNKELSEEQKNAIITIVKDGTMSGVEPHDIAIKIMMSTGIYDIVILNRVKNGVEVIF
mgnify:FL=1